MVVLPTPPFWLVIAMILATGYRMVPRGTRLMCHVKHYHKRRVVGLPKVTEPAHSTQCGRPPEPRKNRLSPTSIQYFPPIGAIDARSPEDPQPGPRSNSHARRDSRFSEARQKYSASSALIRGEKPPCAGSLPPVSHSIGVVEPLMLPLETPLPSPGRKLRGTPELQAYGPQRIAIRNNAE